MCRWIVRWSFLSQKHKVALCVVAVIGAMASPLIPMYDFETFFYPALVEMAHFRSPYTVPGFYNPPWAIVPLLPLGWMPMHVAKQLFFVAMFLAFLYVPLKLGLPWWGLLGFMVSPPVIACLWFGNLEWLVLLALVVPGTIAPILLSLIKPQVGLGVTISSMLKGDAIVSLLCVICLVLFSFVMFGDWANWGTALQGATDDHVNLTLWPAGLLVGVPLMGMGLHKQSTALVLAAMPFLSPYVLFYSWVGPVLGFLMILGGCDVKVDQREREIAESRRDRSFQGF